MGRSPSATRAAALLPFVAVGATLLVACSAGSSSSPVTGSTSLEPAAASEAPSATTDEPSSSSGPSATAGAASATAGGASAPGTPTAAPFRLTSPAFGQNDPIPAQFTCHGADRSPALAWTGAPEGTAALVLTVLDPDAGNFVHWTVLDLHPNRTALPEGLTPTASGIQQGRNGFGNVGYGGPCPPSGTHHYRFTLSALAAPLGLGGHPSGAAVLAALARSGVLGEARLIGTFRA